MIPLGKQRYALDITCQVSVLPPEPEPANGLIETTDLERSRAALRAAVLLAGKETEAEL